MSATNTQENTTSAENNNSTNLTEDHTTSAENNNLTNLTEDHKTSANKNKHFVKLDSCSSMQDLKIETPIGEFILNGKSESSFKIECSEQVFKLIENMVTGTR